MSKTLHEYRDSSWNIDSTETTRNAMSSHREIVLADERWSQRLNRCGKGRKVSNSEHPPYSPDLVLFNCNVFGKLKEHLGARQFFKDGQFQTVVLSWLWGREATFYRQGIEWFVKQSVKWLQRLGGYVQKLCAVCASYFIVVVIKCFWSILFDSNLLFERS